MASNIMNHFATDNPSTDSIRKAMQTADDEISALQTADAASVTLQGVGVVATVAATGSLQTDAAAVGVGFTLVSAADATKGVKLPAAVAGQQCRIKNNANAVLKVWPNTDDAINAIAANSALSMAAFTSAIFECYDGTTWYTTPLLPS